MNKLKIYCKDLNCLPTRAHSTDAGLDLKAAERAHLTHGTTTIVPCGIHIEIPEGYVGLIYPRSGLATKLGISLANSVGIIDSDYRGEIMCALKYRHPGRNTGKYTITKYERIAQLIITPIVLPEVELVDKLSWTVRGEGGFGSSG